jgi:phosphoglycolate phosphatase-like HAD superfamily hydrolase
MLENYLEFKLNGKKAYIKKDNLNQMKKIDGIVFDCDGVLINIKESYNRTIKEVIVYLIEGLIGCNIPKNLISDEIIFLFRKSGGFNNDWDTVYGILMFLLSKLPKKAKEVLQKNIEKVKIQSDIFKRFFMLKKIAKKGYRSDILNIKFFESLFADLKVFTENLDEAGIFSVDKNLLEKNGISKNPIFYNSLKKIIYLPPVVGKSLIPTIFEEFYCGFSLFKEVFGFDAKINKGNGLIDNGEVIIRTDILDQLVQFLGKENLGISSGSRYKTAKYTLGKLLESFNPKALVFLEDVELAEHEYLEKSDDKVILKKPHPYTLLKSVETFRSLNYSLYVGDSMEDFVITQRARKINQHFFFAGVYCYSGMNDRVRQSFIEAGCDMVIPSVNEIPGILKMLRSDKK